LKGRRAIWIVAILTGVFGAFGVLLPLEEDRDAGAEMPTELADEPDLHMENARITQFRADGSVKYHLESAQIRHFEPDELTRLVAPRLVLVTADPKAPWKLQSEYGYIRKRAAASGTTEEVVYLRDEVRIEQVQADGRFVRLQLPSVYLYPDREYAETTQDVMIDTEVGRTRAAGLQGDLRRGLLNLFSSPTQRVHTIVLPQQFK
jgi:lipopolysaccharide export system protein LptC